MSKQDLIAHIANSAGVTKRAAAMALEALTSMITKELKKGNSVTVTGFGTFRVSKRAARMGVPTVATGVDGLFMEVHPDPAKAVSDGPNQIPLEFIEDLLVRLIAIHHAAH